MSYSIIALYVQSDNVIIIVYIVNIYSLSL